MIISQALYQKGNERKNIIILVLGRKNNKVAAILDKHINKKEAEIIMQNNKKLDSYTLFNKLQWFKVNTPSCYKNGYREFFIDKLNIQRSFSLSKKEYIKT